MTNLQILKYLYDNQNCFSSLELCYKENVGIRLAIKSYSSNVIYNFFEEYPNIKKLLSNVVKPNLNNGILEYGVAFDNDIIKIYYVDNMRVIGIDIKNDIIFRIKHYMLIPDSYDIEVYEYDIAGNLTSTSVYEIYDNIDKISINKFELFTNNCQYAYNNSKNQYYVRIYREQFLQYYEILQQML